MRIFLLLIITVVSTAIAHAQQRVRVHVTDGSKPLAGAAIRLSNNNLRGITDDTGSLAFGEARLPDSITVSMLGYAPRTLWLTTDYIELSLEATDRLLDEVTVSTGYQILPKERATGSFAHINNDLFNRSISTDLISRLEGVTNGLQFDRSTITGETDTRPRLRVRGISTINSDASPLIVVDNFPYEGDIENINPNDVEDITILKDAAASSIWGARAGNGVIVITTKRGRYNSRGKVSFNSNLTLSQKPDLFYSREFIPSAEWMDFEEDLYLLGNYDAETFSALPMYAELLIKRDNGDIYLSEFEAQKALMQGHDIRQEATDHLYRQAARQQYALNLNGGGEYYSYYVSGGHDRNLESVIGESYRRTSLTSNGNFRPIKNLELSTSLLYTDAHTENNGINISALRPSGFALSPYTMLADAQGNALPIVNQYRQAYIETAPSLGLLDWNYRPLEERDLTDLVSDQRLFRGDLGLSYHLPLGLSLDAKYQYQHIGHEFRNLYEAESYFARNLVNQFTQANGNKLIPEGGVLRGGSYADRSHTGRFQANYQGTINEKHSINALAGAELRQQVYESNPAYQLYGFDPTVYTGTALLDFNSFYPMRPSETSWGRIPSNASNPVRLVDRFLSYYGNASYEYDSRYALSASARWDGSNIFGVATNQKGVPLWSVGGSWIFSNERFWTVDWVNHARLRATYGANGNVNRTLSAIPTLSYVLDYTTGLQMARLTSAGNPNLRWEQVNTLNIGFDYVLFDRFLTGSIEYYWKKSSDLIGERFFDPTTGIFPISGLYEITNLVNYADMKAKGLDLELNSRNLTGDFKWQTSLLFNMASNEITNYYIDPNVSIISYASTGISPRPLVGKSRDRLLALPWYGLNPQNGQPLIAYGDLQNDDYAGLLSALSVDELVDKGASVPTRQGGLRNTFSYKGIELSANITWKSGYSFYRSSVNYNSMIGSGYQHIDYLGRWMETGDELTTHIPAMPGSTNTSRDSYYGRSEVLVEKGDHIRLQDVRVSYTLAKNAIKALPFERVQLYIYANNLGILWRANRYGIDPDYSLSLYPNVRNISFGLNVNL